MRLFSIQSLSAYRELVNTGRYVCDGTKSEYVLEWTGFKEAYEWLSARMAERIGPPPEGVIYPVWAWPAAVEHFSNDLKPGQVKIEFEAPRDRILLSNFEGWHAVINDYFFAESFEEYDDFEEMEADEKEIAKIDSWEKIFDKTPLDKCQATLWELKLSDVTGVTFPDC